MANYEITSPTSYRVIGQIWFGGSDFRFLVELADWDKEAESTYRWITLEEYPYLIKEGKVQKNPAFRSGLLKHKPGTKRTFFWMNNDEEWETSDPMYAREVKLNPVREHWMTGVHELVQSIKYDGVAASPELLAKLTEIRNAEDDSLTAEIWKK